MWSLRTETHDLGTRRRGRTRTIIGYCCDSTATCELLWRRRNHTRTLLLSSSQQQRWLCRSWVSTILLLLLGLHCVDLRGLSAQSSNASSSLGDAGGGSWELLLQNAGIASMHTALTHFGTLVLLDRTDIGASLLNLPGNAAAPHSHSCQSFRAFFPSIYAWHSWFLPSPFLTVVLVWLRANFLKNCFLSAADGTCRNDPLDLMLKHDCSAHSVLYDPSTNTVRPLTILTDTWCSSGQFMPDGTLLQTGGDYDGATKIR